MAKKEIKAKVKLQCPGGQATPAPPVGPALGQHGVNIGEFVRKFNEATAKDPGTIIPVDPHGLHRPLLRLHPEEPPASVLLEEGRRHRRAAARRRNTDKVGKVTKAQVAEIAKRKMADLNAHKLEAAFKVVAGTARSMGIEIV